MKKFFKMLLPLGLAFSLFSVNVYCADTKLANEQANILNVNGLFKGTEKGFELDKTLTRAEAVTMMVRLMGMADGAKELAFPHPFEDVPQWAAPYVGYAYQNGLTSGVSDTVFGSNNTATVNDYLTLMLRCLGYSDKDGDFSWSNPFDLARNVKILDIDINVNNFTRADVVRISYMTLNAKVKGTEVTLKQKLGIMEKLDKTTQQVQSTSDVKYVAEYFNVTMPEVLDLAAEYNEIFESEDMTGFEFDVVDICGRIKDEEFKNVSFEDFCTKLKEEAIAIRNSNR